MSWAKLSDRFHEHPKFLGLTGDAIALYTFGLTYAASTESDGFIPRAEVPMLAARFDARRRAFKLAALLVERRLWHELPGGFKTARLRSSRHPDGELFSQPNTPDGFQIHDYLDDQPSKQQLLARRKSESEKKSRQRERENARHHDESVPVSPGDSRGESRLSRPDPTRPNPITPPTVGALTSGRPKQQWCQKHPESKLAMGTPMDMSVAPPVCRKCHPIRRVMVNF